MNTLHITSATTTPYGHVERDFTFGEVTGCLWSPAAYETRAPLVLLGHGGGRHSKAAPMAGRARLLVEGGGFHVAAIDAPAHGGRPQTDLDLREADAMQRVTSTGEPVGPIVERYNAHLADRAVPEWRAVLDALQALPEIGGDGPVGYFGINLGTAIGIPLVASEPRIRAAVLGQFWYASVAEAAKQIAVPVEFAMQWDDEHIPREQALALFDAFGSAQKTLHANSGRHKELPRFESENAVHFLVRHLRPPAGRPAT